MKFPVFVVCIVALVALATQTCALLLGLDVKLDNPGYPLKLPNCSGGECQYKVRKFIRWGHFFFFFWRSPCTDSEHFRDLTCPSGAASWQRTSSMVAAALWNMAWCEAFEWHGYVRVTNSLGMARTGFKNDLKERQWAVGVDELGRVLRFCVTWRWCTTSKSAVLSKGKRRLLLFSWRGHVGARYT